VAVAEGRLFVLVGETRLGTLERVRVICGEQCGIDDLDSRHVRRGEPEARCEGKQASKQVRREKVSCWMPTLQQDS
jgi:hypothetical protein